MPILGVARARFCALLALAAVAVACAPKEPSGPAANHASLTGGWWHLVEIASGNETIRPKDPLRYTLTLHEDGAAEMQLDCNKGRGKYSTREKSPTQGEIGIGPLAVTKIFCGAGSLGARVGRDMGKQNSYRIDGNRLAVHSEGGVYVWEQASLD